MAELSNLKVEVERIAKRGGVAAADRDDVVQETLLRVWLRLHEQGESGRAPRNLIHTVMRRIKIDRWRRRAPESSLPDESIGSAHTPLDDVAWSELRDLIRTAIDALPDAQREVVRLRFYDGKPFKEIAIIQGVSVNTALSRAHQAMKRLRSVLEGDNEV